MNPYDYNYFNGGSGAYAKYEYHDGWRQRAARVINLFPQAESFLDVGCAKGFFLRALAENYGKTSITGVDLSAYAISEAPEWLKNVLFCGDFLTEYPCTRQFDVVSAFDVLEHFSGGDIVPVIDKIKSLARVGIAATLMLHRADWDRDRTHQTFLPLEDWINLFEPEFQILAIDPPPGPRFNHVRQAYFKRVNPRESA